MKISLTSIPNSLEVRSGLPRPDWAVVFDWVASHVAKTDLHEAWTQLANDWLDLLIEALPVGYSRKDSPEFTVLSNGNADSTDRILQWCEVSRKTILKTLSGVARNEGYGKHVVLAFGDSKIYYDYIADFYPDEGEFGLSGGMFINNGYGHFAMNMAYKGEQDRIIAHELNHALLRHLPLPLWLNEGVTQVMEDLIVRSSDFMVDREIMQRHRDYWNSETIHSFWSGDSFFSIEGQELSYHLSQIIFRNLMSDYPKKILDFLNSAEHSDAGNEALLKSCEVSLNDRVGQILGDGEWNPRTDYFEREE